MIRFGTGLIAALMLVGSLQAQDAPGLETNKKKVSYAVGRSIGQNLAQRGADFDNTALFQGIRDALAGKDSPLTDEQVQTAFTAFQEEIAKAAMTKSEAYLAENKKKEGVKTTDSGLQYKVMKQGTGAAPKANSVVKVHYHGTLPDGTVFDSSVNRKQPATFPVNRVIKGWTEALQMMKVGAKWQLVIPPELAYGKSGSQGAIGPNQVLIFDVELLGIEEAGAAAPN
ncbi:FKBP-type peptidyl-prolyl cis-trans isomerase [Thalassoroseus pseudoceratinae]|uniref:FKBP-type peptidyl-prolyl cis-trans isomerase n=1 Tax=Thalassoroseus pseudoceratinae TaxID=2713176 RepID=UPI0014247C56|nr:FKBP-type peptidyl-prolyl cis-trans isomerase [Thalassoroseus pseudoceratinae]